MKLVSFRIQVLEIIALKRRAVYKAICDLDTSACLLSLKVPVSEEAQNETYFKWISWQELLTGFYHGKP